MTNSDIIDRLYIIKEDYEEVATTNRAVSEQTFLENVNFLKELSSEGYIIPKYLYSSRSTQAFFRVMQSKSNNYKGRRTILEQDFEKLIQDLDNPPPFSEILVLDDCEEIGNGGYGKVYKYKHKLVDIFFAVKILDPMFANEEEKSTANSRFLREAKMLFALDHPNIVRIYDVGYIKSKLYIKMEYLDGDTLQNYIDKNGLVNFERSIKPILALLKGIAFAHKQGVIHRDLKPSNFMITRKNEFKIIDFGVSAFIDHTNNTKLTATGKSVIGNSYSDPQIISNPKLIDARSDIYAIGAIWYFILTGKSPHGSDMRKILENSSNIQQNQVDIIMKCLSYNLNDRFSSCNELLLAIERLSKARVF